MWAGGCGNEGERGGGGSQEGVHSQWEGTGDYSPSLELGVVEGMHSGSQSRGEMGGSVYGPTCRTHLTPTHTPWEHVTVLLPSRYSPQPGL